MIVKLDYQMGLRSLICISGHYNYLPLLSLSFSPQHSLPFFLSLPLLFFHSLLSLSLSVFFLSVSQLSFGLGQLTVKGSSNRMLPRFQEPILDRLRFLESRKYSIRGTFYCQLPLFLFSPFLYLLSMSLSFLYFFLTISF